MSRQDNCELRRYNRHSILNSNFANALQAEPICSECLPCPEIVQWLCPIGNEACLTPRAAAYSQFIRSYSQLFRSSTAASRDGHTQLEIRQAAIDGTRPISATGSGNISMAASEVQRSLVQCCWPVNAWSMKRSDGIRRPRAFGPEAKRKREHAPALVAAVVALLGLLQSNTRRHLADPKSR